jgi:nitroreductase
MDFLELVRKRQSVRKYIDRPVEKDKIERCLEAARLAPSTSNSQPWKFIVVDDPHLKNAIAREAFGKVLSFNRFALEAPVLVVLVTERGTLTSRFGSKVKDKDFALIDMGIAAVQFCLQATEEGLGTCILGWFDEKGAKMLLGVPAESRVYLMITLGYAASGEIRPKKRKRMDEIAYYNRYG